MRWPLLFITSIPFVMHCYGEQNVIFLNPANLNKLTSSVEKLTVGSTAKHFSWFTTHHKSSVLAQLFQGLKLRPIQAHLRLNFSCLRLKFIDWSQISDQFVASRSATY